MGGASAEFDLLIKNDRLTQTQGGATEHAGSIGFSYTNWSRIRLAKIGLDLS